MYPLVVTRHPRTLVEAFPQHEAWRGVITRYRRPLAERVARVLPGAVLFASLVVIGVQLAWRG